jgi:hypothetical protein
MPASWHGRVGHRGHRRVGHRGHGGRGRHSRARRAGRAGLIAVAARRLQEARRHEPGGEAEAHHRQRLAPAEVLQVAEDPVGPGLAEVRADALGVVGDLLGHLRRAVLAFVAQLPARGPQGVRGGADLLSGLRRALIDLVTHPRVRLLRAFLDLLPGVLRLLLHLFLGGVGRRA